MDRFYRDKDSVIEALPPPRPEPPPLVHTLYEELTGTWQYVVADPISRHSVIIDPHLDNSVATSSTETSTIAADRVLNVVRQNQYTVDRIIHTHESRDHPSSAWYIRTQIQQSTGQAPQVSIGKKMAAVHRVFKRKYSMNDGSQWRTDFEHTFSDGQIFPIGNITARVLHLNGGNLAFVIGRHVFAGTSKLDLEARNRQNALVGDLTKYNVYSAYDDPPARTAKLTPIQESGESSRNPMKKLVIRYAAQH